MGQIKLHLLVPVLLSVKVYLILAAIPSYIHVCRRDDPLAHICINNSIEALRTKLAEGIPELDVPPIEPLHIPTIRLKRGTRGAQIDANMTNIQVFGCSAFRIDELKTDLVNNVFNFKLTLPKLKFQGKYSMNMNILFLRVAGKGDMFGNFTDYKPTVFMKGNKIQRDGQTYLQMGKMKIDIKVGSAQIKLTNLFNGDPVLGKSLKEDLYGLSPTLFESYSLFSILDRSIPYKVPHSELINAAEFLSYGGREATNRILNENQKIFLEEIRPALEEALSTLFTDISNKITLRFTYDELFL